MRDSAGFVVLTNHYYTTNTKLICFAEISLTSQATGALIVTILILLLAFVALVKLRSVVFIITIF